ncbi:hypothetical protein [Allomesorhizobium camelthorni]|uniref:Uncharacterized protein n=1 Tax=Allomesorhizobium camelthorni TaxID=475069 RepID=A0A6G4WBV0_9HYPH|nr:hypothetical protein [Mesorhizobium camelthorni]NGO51597.1 hypothetical protein [Mesorhizobium camelthorni]
MEHGPPFLISNILLEKLPLYADDHDIAVAVVGRERAAYFKSILPILERKGFPQKCPLHGGRSVFLIKAFYTSYFYPEQKAVQYRAVAARTEEARYETERRMAEWGQRQAEKKARAKANSDAWAAKKKKALEEFRAKKAAETKLG